MDSEAPLRVAIVATHPIQHFVPFYRALSRSPDLQVRVFFASRIGLDAYFDREMNVTVKWNMDLTSDYDHEFLPRAERIRSTGFLSMNNLAVWRALRRFDPAAVVVYGYANITALWTILGAKARRIPILLVSDSELLGERSSLRSRVKQAVLPVLARNISAFLTVGDSNERYWSRYGVAPEKLFRSPFTIDESQYLDARARRAEIRRAWRRAHRIAEDEVVFLAVGKLSARKRQDDLLAALRLLGESAGPARVVLAGDGDMRPVIERMAAQAGLPATFLGFVNVDRLPETYAAADVLAHPSGRDPHPLVFSEAACIGLPILASDRIGAVGPTDIARPGENAIIHPVGDVQTLAAAMRILARDPALRADMSAASIRIFESQNAAASVAGLRAGLRAALSPAMRPAVGRPAV